MKIWVIGAGGFVGKALVRVCLEKNIACTASERGEIDITNLSQLQKGAEKIAPTHLINCAAFTDVDLAEKEHQRAFLINGMGAEHIGVVGREMGIQVLHLSTDYVFDGRSSRPYRETDPISPLGIYGKSKREGEERLLSQLATACIVRTSWVFGVGGATFISKLIPLLLASKEVEVDNLQESRATYHLALARDLLDLVSAQGIYHLAHSPPSTRYKIAKEIYRVAQSKGILLPCHHIVPNQSNLKMTNRPLYSPLNTEKVERALGRKLPLWETLLSEYVAAHF